MDQKRIIDEFKELVSIEVHSRDERAIAAFAASALI